MAHDVFISYSRKDKAVADAVYEALTAQGIRCWMDRQDIRVGEYWSDVILPAVRQSKAVILLFSEHVVGSHYTESEIREAVNHRVTVIPLRLSDTPYSDRLKAHLGSVQWDDLFPPPPDQYFSRLIENVRHYVEKGTVAEPSRPPLAHTVLPTSQPGHPQVPRSGQELPSGTVTFFFSDLEKDAQLWEARPEAMQRAVARYETLFRQAVAERGGVSFRASGGDLCAAFARAPEALRAALAVQGAVQGETWGGMEPLRVRMALHSGVAEVQAGEYAPNPTLSRLAQLLAAGHGGQTLLSRATQELTRDNLPEGAQVRDLGMHPLKDLLRPEHIFQVILKGGRSDFPALNTDRRPHNLPTQATPLIGREEEVARLKALLHGKARLVTLTGPGGAGKTRLSVEVANELLEDFADGVCFVELAATHDPDLVLSAVAQALKVPETGQTPLLESVTAALKDQRMLLVLDNFEQVIEAANLVGELLSACPGVQVLATSRERLRLKGEREYPVPPLALPDPKGLFTADAQTALSQFAAVKLFLERATAVKPDFSVTNETAPIVAEICIQLDGLPLAIELAAARAKMLSLQAMLTKLTGVAHAQSLSLLTRGARDLPARQQTLRAAIAWSYDLLTPDEQTLFRRLAVFQGGQTLEAVEAVCDQGGKLDVFDGLESLLDKSLLRQEEVDGAGRFTMLKTIHEFACEQLEVSGEAAALKRAHAEYFLTFAEEADPHLGGGRQVEWLNRLAAEHDNLRAALSWLEKSGETDMLLRLTGALWLFWAVRGHLSEGRERIRKALSLAETAEYTTACGKTLDGAGVLARLQNDYDVARLSFERSLKVRRELKDDKGVAKALSNLGNIARRQNGFALARSLYEESLAIQERLNDERGIAATLNSLANLACDQTNYDEANELYLKSLAVWRKLDNAYATATLLGNLGNVAYHKGDYAAAQAIYQESLDLKRVLGDKPGIAALLDALANLSFFLNDYDTARKRCEESLARYEELEDTQGAAGVLNNLAMIVYEQGQAGVARSLLRKAVAMMRDAGDKRGVVECLERFSALAVREEGERAARLWRAAEAFRQEAGIPLLPSERKLYKRYLAVSGEQVGKASRDAVATEGRALTLEEAVAYALAASDEVAT